MYEPQHETGGATNRALRPSAVGALARMPVKLNLGPGGAKPPLVWGSCRSSFGGPLHCTCVLIVVPDAFAVLRGSAACDCAMHCGCSHTCRKLLSVLACCAVHVRVLLVTVGGSEQVHPPERTKKT